MVALMNNNRLPLALQISSSECNLVGHRVYGCWIQTKRRLDHGFVVRRESKWQGSGESEGKSKQQPTLSLEDVSPVGLGRKSRQIFDEVWRKFSELGQISRTHEAQSDDSLLFIGGPSCEFSVPGASDTTVLVVGATSRVGRILAGKLMIRGYREVIDMLPRSVEIVVGDVGEPSTLRAAVEGCNKIIYCATARSTVTGDLNRVDYQGDYNNKPAQLRAGKSSKSKLLLAKFRSSDCLEGWEVRRGTYFQDVIATKYDGGMDAKFEFTENGYVYTRGGYVELSKRLSLQLGSTLDRLEKSHSGDRALGTPLSGPDLRRKNPEASVH